MVLNKKYKILGILGTFIISSMLAGSIIRDTNDAVKMIEDNIEMKNLKKSDFWTNFTYIHVKNNWSNFGPWLKGEGSWSNPYRIENMTIDATGTPTGAGILIEDSQNVFFEIRNITITNWGGGAYDGGIVLLNSSNGLLEDNNCSGGTSNGIIINGDLTGTSSNNTLYSNIVDNNGGNGIRIMDYASGNWVISNKIRGNNYGVVIFDHGLNNTIKFNNITGNTRGIFLQEYSDNNVIKFNNISDNGYGIYFMDYNDDNIIHHNLISGNTNDGIYLWLYNDLNYIADNNITGSYIGIHLNEYNDYNTIQNNNVSYNGQYGIHLEYTCFYNNIENNTVNYNFGVSFNNAGIFLWNYCDFNNITQNTVIGNSYFGIWMLSGSDNNLINNNTVSDHAAGINIQSSDSNTVLNNTISLSTTEGIKIHVNTLGNIIKKNTIDNNQWGIHLVNNGDTTDITENLIINNTAIGIFIEDGSCEINEVWLNYFINNLENAQDDSDSSDNSWFKEGFGNYWDDYGGNDENDDGIGDVPHNITGFAGSQDNYTIWDDGDDIFPNITIINPIPNQLFGAQAPDFSVEIRDKNLHKMWYTIDNGLNNYTFISNVSIYQPAWDLESNGTVTIGFYANDTGGNISFKEVTVRIDILAPILTILNPLNNDIRAKTNRTFNFIIVEENLDTMWYSIAGGQNHKFTVNGSLNQADWDTAWDATTWDGSFLVRFYANDTAGNIISVDIWVRPNKQAPSSIPFGYNYFIIIGISTIALIVIKKRKLNQK
ncbi:hypothetical protein LCGC14_1771160 [marine sediment metagenome]|uniref:Periplasmic copper-binding protein NosD beta helix domain-containing protein n=1 Tax=marine sediment metagenome TaxID=412755 RepID=A0A0F9GY96_9ZZZZ